MYKNEVKRAMNPVKIFICDTSKVDPSNTESTPNDNTSDGSINPEGSGLFLVRIICLSVSRSK